MYSSVEDAPRPELIPLLYDADVITLGRTGAVITGIEPLPDHHITRMEGLYEGQTFTCDAVCRLKLPITAETGATLQFWAVSSYGDTSEIFNAIFRVAVTDGGNPDQSYWYVDVLSSQWAGVPVASCVEAWGALPPVGGPPRWLSTPTRSEILGTDVPYNYLAANLIRRGQVDVSSCTDGGLLADGTASTCGIEQSRTAVNEWQNQFDTIILNIGKDTGVPAHLLKNLFAKESQFWPGTSVKNDVGLGQLTGQGDDTTLLWNPPFFRQFCPLVMDSAECVKGLLLHAIREAQEGRLKSGESFRVHSDCTPRSRVALIGDLADAADMIQRLIVLCRQRGAEAIYCLGNLIGSGASSKTILSALRKGYVNGILVAADWINAQIESGAERPLLDTTAKDQLIQLPHLVQFQLGSRKAVAFFGQYVQQLPGYSDFDPFTIEINLVCGLTDFMQDEAVFPALEAMAPQFQADLVLFSQPRAWGHWRVGGKDFISVGPAWDGRQMAWGLLEAGMAGALFQTILEPFHP